MSTPSLWPQTIGEPDSRWLDTVPLVVEPPPPRVRPPALAQNTPARPGWGDLAARLMWFVSLTLGATCTLLVSHLGLESQLGTYEVASIAELHTAGRWSLFIAVGTLAGLILAAGLRARYRPALPYVAAQVLGVFFLGVPWAVLTTLGGSRIGWEPAAALSGLGGLVAGLLWLRLLTRCGGPRTPAD